jgi:hypothetical protein
MQDSISEIGLDGSGKLYVVPSTAKFPFIYREAMQVEWDIEQNCLRSPIPREWSYLRWFQQIVCAAAEQGCMLHITERTTWKQIPSELQGQIISFSNGSLSV